jgi:tRNA G10  N-methylase Trm11
VISYNSLVAKAIAEHIAKRPKNPEATSKNTDFSLSSYVAEYNISGLNKLGFGIKNELKRSGVATRFIMLKDDKETSSALVIGNKLVGKGLEFGIFKSVDTMCVGELIAVSNPNGWSLRDYGKPRGDKRSGMLPPKLARIMLNLAVSTVASHPTPPRLRGAGKSITESQNDEILKQVQDDNIELEIRNSSLEIPQDRVLVVDPFCGSGNALIEAVLEGYDVFGSDLSEKAVDDSKINLEWLMSEAGLPLPNENPYIKIQKFDATGEELAHALKLEIGRYDRFVFVGEPFLGEPKKFKPSANAVAGEYKKIKELYLNFFRNMATFLSEADVSSKVKQATFCIVFPLVETSEDKIFSLLANSVDEIKKIGYTVHQRSLFYGRDYQVVKREIALFQFKI